MLSIIIPFCNEMPQVLFTAQSIYNQLQGREFEIILVDNRSTDKTLHTFGKGVISNNNYFPPGESADSFTCYSADWAQAIQQRNFFDKAKLPDKVVYLRYDDKLSHWNAKNAGVAASKYPYLFFLDAHCELSNEAIIKLLRFLKHTDNKQVGAAHCLINYMMDTCSLEYKMVPETFCYQFKTAQHHKQPYAVPIMSTCGMMMTREVWEAVGGWHPELGIYGGGEAYMGYKLGTLGYEHWIVPSSVCWHYAEGRGYSWNLWDWVRNNLIAAYVVGGDKWLKNLVGVFSKDHNAEILDEIATNVRKCCAVDRKRVAAKQVCSYDDLVARWCNDAQKPNVSEVKPTKDNLLQRISIIIPARNERDYLNHTIENIYATAATPPEVILIDNGGNGEIDKRARILKMDNNVGERAAMNRAVEAARCEYVLRIDAHCDFTPNGWDMMMAEATGPKDITVAVLTAIRNPWDCAQENEKKAWLASGKTPEQWHGWERLKGHWYGLVRLIISEHEPGMKGIEGKWQKANRDHAHYKGIVPNMGLTGCGFMLRKSFYQEIGGADESLPPMGAIGEEFALKAWAADGKVQTHMDVTIGHIFGTKYGGYDTSGVVLAQQKLWLKYQDIYPKICEKFPEFEGLTLVTAEQPGRVGKPGKPERVVTVKRTDTMDLKDDDKIVGRLTTIHQYIWVQSMHPKEKDWTQRQIEDKYAPLADIQVSKTIEYLDEKGNVIGKKQSDT